MGNKRNFAALEWVVGEIGDTLDDARQSLEAYVEDPKDSTRIRFCLTHIHQVHGSLQMVEFHGAALLAEEMEHTAQAIMDEAVTSLPEAQEVLMRGLLQLPLYLDHIKAHKEDNAVRVLPLLNDMRAVRKQSYLSETNLFSPDLSAAKALEGGRHPVLDDADKFAQVIAKLREMFQVAAAGVLRGVRVDENIDYLDKVLSRLELMTRGTHGHAIWEVAGALIDAIKRDDLELSVAVRGLLRYIARELRILSEKSVAALSEVPRESLLKNLLFYVAKARPGSDKVADVKSRYKLDQALSGGKTKTSKSGGGESRDMLQTPDADTIRSVVAALQDELGSIKRLLDASLSGDGSSAELKEVIPLVKRVADTLAVLGIGDLRKHMVAQCERLEEMSNATSLDSQALMDVAHNIIEMEHRLQAIGKSAGRTGDLASVNEREVEIDAAKAAVVQQCTEGLLRAKESIVEYISSQWEKSHLESVCASLDSIRGGLNMIPLRRPAAIISSCARYIQEQLLENNEHPSFQSLESLADAMSSVEYYLERLVEDMYEDSDAMLDIAEESIASLGYAIELPPPRPEQHDQAPLATPEVEEQPPEEVTAEAISEEHADESQESEAQLSPQSLEDSGADADADAQSQADSSADTTDAGITEPAESQNLQREESTSSEDIESDIDDEIIEIFIEEAGEVLETLNEYYPQWKESENDQDALVVVRRAFHTLKGSGRMVEAYEIGELAWSIENMLNRIIDRTIKPKPPVFHLVEAVMAIVPTMVRAFENRKTNPLKAKARQYERWGHEISEGNFPEELADPIAPLTDEELSHVSSEKEQSDDELELSSVSNDESHDAHSMSDGSAEQFTEIQSEDSEDEVDKVLQEIFSQEAVTHLETVDDYIETSQREAPVYDVPSDNLQRALHTLKGSAKMAQVWSIAEITEPLEAFCKELISFQVKIDGDTLQLIKDAAEYTRIALDQIERGEKVDIPKISQFVARTEELRALAVGHLLLSRESEDGNKQKVDPRMLSLVMAEEVALLLDADRLLKCWQDDGVESVFDDVRKLIEELKVLEEGARQANLQSMATVSSLLCTAHQMALRHELTTDADFFHKVRDGHEALLDMVDAVAAGQNVQSAPETIANDLSNLINSAQAYASDDSQTAAQTSDEIALDTTEDLQAEEQSGQEIQEGETSTYDELEVDFGPADEHEAVPDIEEDDFHFSEEEVNAELGVATEGNVVEETSEESESAPELPEEESEVSLDPTAFIEPTEQPAEPISQDQITTLSEDEIPAGVDVDKVAVIPGLIDEIDIASEDFDADILEVFLEEADELVEGLDEAIHSWESDWSDTQALDEMKRILHTLKGGARLAGMEKLGELTHDYETMLVDLGDDISNIDNGFFALVHTFQDGILNAVKAVKAFVQSDLEVGKVDTQKLSETPGLTQTSSELDAPAPAEEPAQEDKNNIVQFERKSKETAAPSPQFSMPPVAGGRSQGGGQTVGNTALKKSGPQEMVKVAAELLEELVNLAGETSINRSRLEQYINDFGFSLEEIETTLSRMQDQLRRLDIETEAQILFRQEQMEAHDEFDPLEMDRYSNLQHLSRSLIESASDLTDLRTDLADRVRQTETLLLQQSRVNTTLQEGLMRSRMVPFSRLVPRLRRIVRQVATELGKNISFELDNVEGELDRSVLERMVAPFEHMLRNAVDHGIESPEERTAAGKNEQGRIVLSLAREGGDVVIRLADDGRGVNLERVRQKAIERELMSPDAELSDYDIMQFILHAGFSTADKVTQISGRGVGMDVVHAEIKQLGGSVIINSKWGQGTEFVVRLPFTLSVNRALMVAIGQDQYAVPLSSIEGIVRVSPFELDHYYENPEAKFEYASENYDMRYLGALLHTNATPSFEGQVLPLPVLLVRSAEHMMALQVDAVMGSREIVVKSLGPQFSSVAGLSGATVMGDGSVVVILDPHAIVRQEIAKSTLIEQQQSRQIENYEERESDRVRTVMVVDDSVTVRKVTTRFLEREGYEVITAKDGVDALQVLQERLPDLMLLDIEMPRMDGFEVAKTVRNTQRWQSLPIIMITSRTGDKHREHAMSLGVDRYMGKPYQEDKLIETISEILDNKSGRLS